MSLGIQIQLSDRATELLNAFGQIDARVGKAIAVAMDMENELTVAHIQEDKLSRRGPDTLGVRTNRLRKSARPTRAVVNMPLIESSIGSNVLYAGPHEFGFQGTVQVPAHKRRVIALDRYRRTSGGGFVKTQSGIRGTVRAHPMKLNIPARAPFRRGIEDRRQAYGEALSQAIVTVLSPS